MSLMTPDLSADLIDPIPSPYAPEDWFDGSSIGSPWLVVEEISRSGARDRLPGLRSEWSQIRHRKRSVLI